MRIRPLVALSAAVLSLLAALLTTGPVAARPVTAGLSPSVAAAADGGGGGGGGKYGLTNKQRDQVDRSRSWARTDRAKSARQCRSGNDYRREFGAKSGAYLMPLSTWRSLGGKQFGRLPLDAPKFAQDYIAWKLHKQSGWAHLGCLTGHWMQSMYVNKPKTTIGDILIPGSHDSATAPIDVDPPCNPEFIYGAAGYLDAAKQQNPCGVALLARTQSQDLGDQLRNGIRYLDLRIGVRRDQAITAPPVPKLGDPTKVPLVLHHEVIAQRLSKGLGQIINFANSHPAEQLVLDFQHVQFPTDPVVNRYYQDTLVKLLTDWTPKKGQRSLCDVAYSHKAFPVPDANLSGVAIGKAWNLAKNVIVIFPPGAMPSRSCFRDRQQMMVSLWANTEDPDFNISFNHEVTQERQDILSSKHPACYDPPNSAPDGKANEAGDWCGLFVNQMQLSFQAATQANCLFSATPPKVCSLFELSQTINDRWPSLVRQWRMKQDLPMNITITDFFEHSDPSLVDTMIKVNWRVLDR